MIKFACNTHTCNNIEWANIQCDWTLIRWKRAKNRTNKIPFETTTEDRVDNENESFVIFSTISWQRETRVNGLSITMEMSKQIDKQCSKTWNAMKVAADFIFVDVNSCFRALFRRGWHRFHLCWMYLKGNEKSQRNRENVNGFSFFPQLNGKSALDVYWIHKTYYLISWRIRLLVKINFHSHSCCHKHNRLTVPSK